MTISPHSLHYSQKTFEVEIDDLIIARFPSANVLRDNAEAIAELLYDSIEVFAVRTGIRTTRFGDAYSAAVRITLSTLDKSYLRGVCRFEKLPITAALRWLKSRLLSNLKTVLTNPRSAEWLGHVKVDDFDTVTFGNAEIESELAGLTREQVADGLKKLFIDGVDLGELEYLADRFGIDLSAVIGVYTTLVVVERSPDGSPQLAFDF